MQDEIGTAAGLIWQVLNDKGELPLTQLMTKTRVNKPIFDWAIGWLAREDKIVITPDKRSFRICLKGKKARPATAM